MIEFQMSDFDIIGEIGRGAFASVKLVEEKKSGKKMAMKVYKYPEEDLPEYEGDFVREISMLVSLNHPCISTIWGFLKDEHELAYTMKYMENGSLERVLERIHNGEVVDGFGPTQKSIIAYGVASALHYLHMNARSSGAIMHRDLKGGNILLDEKFHPKISDFGFAKLLRTERNDDYNTQARGSWPWMAPEVMMSSYYGQEADVFSYAMILYEMLSGEAPFAEFTTRMQYIEAVGVRGERPTLPAENQRIGHLIEQCWCQDPSKRLTFGEVKEKFERAECVFDGTDIMEFRNYVKMLAN